MHSKSSSTGSPDSPTFLMEAAPELPEPEYLQKDRQHHVWNHK